MSVTQFKTFFLNQQRDCTIALTAACCFCCCYSELSRNGGAEDSSPFDAATVGLGKEQAQALVGWSTDGRDDWGTARASEKSWEAWYRKRKLKKGQNNVPLPCAVSEQEDSLLLTLSRQERRPAEELQQSLTWIRREKSKPLSKCFAYVSLASNTSLCLNLGAFL